MGFLFYRIFIEYHKIKKSHKNSGNMTGRTNYGLFKMSIGTNLIQLNRQFYLPNLNTKCTV